MSRKTDEEIKRRTALAAESTGQYYCSNGLGHFVPASVPRTRRRLKNGAYRDVCQSCKEAFAALKKARHGSLMATPRQHERMAEGRMESAPNDYPPPTGKPTWRARDERDLAEPTLESWYGFDET